MLKYLKYLTISLVFPLIFISCGTSVGSRYQESSSIDKTKKVDTLRVEYAENFNLTNYRTKLNLPAVKSDSSSNKNPIWFNYESKPDTSNLRTVSKTEPGYRVLAFTSDNLNDADSMRTDISSKTGRNDIYIIFDPPFYKVQAGDFTNITDAKNLSFQFKQLGYDESRVISSRINIYK